MFSLQVCVQDFCEELEYWGLTDLHLEPCCQHTYYRARWLLPSYGIQVSYNISKGAKMEQGKLKEFSWALLYRAQHK